VNSLLAKLRNKRGQFSFIFAHPLVKNYFITTPSPFWEREGDERSLAQVPLQRNQSDFKDILNFKFEFV
jgi:hypothetical protein